MYDALGKVLKEAREASGYSQRAAATEMGLSNATLSRVEDGTRKEPPEKLEQLLEGYSAITRISVDRLLERWGAEIRRQSRRGRDESRRPTRADTRA